MGFAVKLWDGTDNLRTNIDAWDNRWHVHDSTACVTPDVDERDEPHQYRRFKRIWHFWTGKLLQQGKLSDNNQTRYTYKCSAFYRDYGERNETDARDVLKHRKTSVILCIINE